MKKNVITMAVQHAIFASAMVLAPQAFAGNEADIEKKSVKNNQVSEQEIIEVDEKITVTGSRLRRDSFTVATPLVTMGKEAISDTGLGELAEILVDNMPSLSYGISNSTSQSSVSTTGLTTIQLRDLGTNRTLTLIDGRRVVSNSYSGNYISMSTIPSGMVERVEIITGGASSTYGADAISGVVNIITQSGKEGFGVKVRGGESTEGGGKEYTLDLNYGATFSDDRGYLYFSTTYDKQYGIKYGDRARAAIETDYDYDPDKMCNTMNTADGDQCMRDITQADWRSKSDGTFGGVFLESSKFDKNYWYDGQTLRDDWKGNEERYGINTRQFVQLKVPSERISTALKLDYDVTDDVTFYSQIQYSGNATYNDKSPEDDYEGASVLFFDPETGEPGRIKPGYIPIDNPYVPQEIRDTAGQYKDRIYWDRRFKEVGNIATDNDRTTVRSWAGLQGTMLDGDWDWDVSVGYGKFHQEQKRYNELNIFRVQNALNAEQLADGTIQCADADDRAAGCQPLNLFGEGSISAESADYIRSNPTLNTYIEQTSVMGYIAGDLFELPAGPVATVFGAEYRKDSQDLQTNKELQNGGITWNVVPAFKGDISVAEVFTEASFPLLRDAVAAKSLSLEVSLRLSDYDIETVDLVSSYKAGFLWQPIEGYMLRGNWARAQRAPTITELMSPARGDFDRYRDICDDVTATSTEAGHDNCRLEPSIAALIAEDSQFKFEDDNGGYSPGIGNQQLTEETGDTITFGITMEPAFLSGFRLAVDYYDITVTDAISVVGNEEIIKECYNSSTAWGSDNAFCQDITRDSEGQIIEVLQRNYNLDELRTRGYDIAAEYATELGEYGSLKFKLDWTHVLENSKTYEGNDGLVKDDYVGLYGSFEDKASLSVAWYKEAWRVRWSTNFKSSVILSQNRAEEHQEYVAENDALCAAGDVDCVANPEPLNFQNYGAYIKHNLSVSYDIELKNDSSVRLFGGVNNVFDDKGEFLLGGRGNFGSEYDSGVGRFVYLGAELNF